MSARAAALAAVLLAAAWPRAARAEPTALTWDAVVAAASESNPDLASSRFSLESSRASLYQSFNGFMPAVSLSNGAAQTSLQRHNHWTAELDASMNLFDASKLAAIRSASADVSFSEAGLRKASADLRQSLRQAWAHLLFAQESRAVAESISRMRDRNAQMIRLRYDSGTAAKGDMLLAQAQALQARLEIVSAERDLRAARREMAQRLGREEFEEYAASGTLGAAPPPARPDDLIPLLALRPEVLQAQAAVRQAAAGVSKADSSLWPSLNADYSRTRGGGNEFPASTYAWAAGLTLSYPLFGNGPTSTWYGTKAAKNALRSAREELTSARVAGLADMEGAWASYADAVDQVQITSAILAADRQRNDEADVEYSSGLMIYENWQQIASARIQQENQMINALKSAMDAETAWDRALGRGLGE